MLLLSIACIAMSSSAVHQTDGQVPFFGIKQGDSYWEALLEAGKEEKQKALLTLKTGGIEPYAWKEIHPENITDFFDRLFLLDVFYSPEGLTNLGLFETIGVRRHNAYLSDLSMNQTKRQLKRYLESYESLKKYSLAKLTEDEKISHQIAMWSLGLTAEMGEKFLFHSFPMTQLFGIVQEQTALFTLFHPLELAEDVSYYLDRLRAIPRQIDQIIDLMSYQEKKGIVPPRFALEKGAAIVQAFATPPAEKSPLYIHLAQKIQTIEGASKTALQEAREILETSVLPAYTKLQKKLEALLATHPQNHGAWALPSGDQYYALVLKSNTTTELTPDEVHELGLKEVKRIQNEMRTHFAKEGLDDPNKSIGTLLQEMANNPRFYYPNTDEGRLNCLKDYLAILDKSRRELGPLFDLKPKAPVQVHRVPPLEEEGAPGAYYRPGSADGSRPGVFYINLGDMKSNPKFQMETLAVHEAEPGHHFQISLQFEIPMPLFRKFGNSPFTAYIEGWALYAETLAYEQNFYTTSFDRIGHLQYDLLRAARLVLDTGIHAKRWSREQAIAYMTKETGFDEGTVVSEIERYFVMPGQACSYKIGQLKILELRERAKQKMGAKFDIRLFHNEVLKIGPVPLSVLEERIDAYIKTRVQSP